MRSAAVLCAALLLASAARPVAAQPSPPATFFGSVTLDGHLPAAGTEVLALVDGKDCAQRGPAFRGTVIDAGVGAYVVSVMHESQEPGCGREGRIVRFTVGGKPALQTAPWKTGPQRLDLTTSAGTPVPLPTATPAPPATATPSPPPATAVSAAGTGAVATVGPSALPTDDVRLPILTPKPPAPLPGQEQAAATVLAAQARRAHDDGGGGIWLPVLVGLGALGVAGGAGGLWLSRRKPAR